jgi:hypothetical protein
MIAVIYRRCPSHPLEREAFAFRIFLFVFHPPISVIRTVVRFILLAFMSATEGLLYGTKVLMPVGYREMSIVPGLIAH